MYQPQNSQGNQQPPQQQPGQPYPQQPPSYPEVKPLPKGWQQPINLTPQGQQQQPPPNFYQQQQPPQYYGGAQPPKAVKPWPSWATALLIIGAIFIVAILGIVLSSNSKTSTTTTTTNNQQVVATAGPTQKVAQAAATTVPTLKLGKVGETIALNGYTVTVNGVERSENFDTSNEVGKAKPGNIMVAVDITIGSTKDKGTSSNGLDASLKDDKGFKYDFSILGQKEPRLPGENNIPTGDKVRGWVTFEVPQTAKGLVLEYGQMFESEKVRVALS